MSDSVRWVLGEQSARLLRGGKMSLFTDPRPGPKGPRKATGALRAYRRLGPAARARLANPLAPGMTGPLLMWVAEHEPGTYRDARWALAPKDWLRARLTGEIHAEPSDASASLLYDVPGDRWDLDVVGALGLDAGLLAPLLPSAGAPAGHLTAAAAAELGLPAGIPVAAGAGDIHPRYRSPARAVDRERAAEAHAPAPQVKREEADRDARGALERVVLRGGRGACERPRRRVRRQPPLHCARIVGRLCDVVGGRGHLVSH